MTSTSMRSMYKTKMKEGSTTSTRRRSKGLERKSKRDGEVNKRRLISDDMSPVVEDCDDQKEQQHPKGVRHQAAGTRRDRLKQWREERKRKMEEDKKNLKPMFKVSGVKHSGETEIYKREMMKEVKTKPEVSIPSKPQASVKVADIKKNPKTVSSVTSSARIQSSASTRLTRSSARAARASVTKPVQSDVVSKPAPGPLVSNEKPLTRRSRPKGNGTDLYSKLTASAAAKAKTNLDKPKEFLRAKSRTNEKVRMVSVTKERKYGLKRVQEGLKDKKGQTRTQNNVLKVDSMVPEEPEEIALVMIDQEDDGKSSSDSKELHLSDSAVSTPKHSTPTTRKSSSHKLQSHSMEKIRMEVGENMPDSILTSGSKRSGKKRKSRAPRRSGRNLSVIQVSDVQAAMNFGKFESDWSFRPVAEDDTESEMTDVETSHKVFIFKGSSSEEETNDAGKVSCENQSRRKSQRCSIASAAIPNSPKQETSSSNILDEENEEINPLEISNKENIADRVGMRERFLRKSVTKHSKSLIISSVSKRKSDRKISDENLGQPESHDTANEQVSTPAQFRRNSRSLSSVSRRRSRRLVFSNDDEVKQEESAPSPVKRARRSVVQQAMECLVDDMEGTTADRVTDVDDTQAVEAEPATPVSQQRVRMGSAMAKRRSIRLAALVTSGTEDSTTGSEGDGLARNLKTPRSSKRKSTGGRRSSVVRKTRRSVLVSVSDEGTTDIGGENIIESVKTTPRHDHKFMVSLSHHKVSPGQRSTRRSEVIDVSDEGTALAEKDDDVPSIVYQVAKPAVSESSVRVLQELDVQKVDGEISFIEVSADESMDAALPVMEPSTSSPTDCNHQPAVGTMHTDGHCTQPFTPRRSDDMSKITASSTQSLRESPKATSMAQTPSTHISPTKNSSFPSAPKSTHNQTQRTPDTSPSSKLTESSPVTTTPRSNRRRGQSIVPSSFKTPGPPLSALRAKSEKRRKTEHSAPSKSPEEMIEILKRSPMIEMTRRRSRHVSSPAATSMNPVNTDTQLVASSSAQTKSNTSAPELSDMTRTETVLTQDTTTISVAASPESLVPSAVKPLVAEKVKYFRDLLTSETNRLNQLCTKWNEVSSVTPGLEEEVLGQIRSTVGKAQLLIAQRFKQFLGLVDNCEFGLGEKETTPTDLQGFWEMIYFQVEDVDQLFANLSELQQNNWKVKQPLPAKIVPKPKKAAVKISKPKVKSNFAAFRQELMKRKVQATKAKSPAPGTVTSEENSDTTKVFDAGFFRVTSPVRSPAGKRSKTPQKHAVSDEVSPADKNGDQNFTSIASKSTDSINSKPSTPVSHIDKENQIKNTPNSSRLMSMTAKRLSYVPVIPSPLLNDITGIVPKK